MNRVLTELTARIAPPVVAVRMAALAVPSMANVSAPTDGRYNHFGPSLFHHKSHTLASSFSSILYSHSQGYFLRLIFNPSIHASGPAFSFRPIPIPIPNSHSFSILVRLLVYGYTELVVNVTYIIILLFDYFRAKSAPILARMALGARSALSVVPVTTTPVATTLTARAIACPATEAIK